MSIGTVVLKAGREKSVLQRHPWIFSQAIETSTNCSHGGIVGVYGADNAFLGHATISLTSALRCRMIAFGAGDYRDAVRNNICNAVQLRALLFQNQATDSYRLINAEGDCLPGVIVDKYADCCVLQIATAGAETLKPIIIEQLQALVHPTWIYEKSLSPARKEEQLSPFEGTLIGTPKEAITIRENNLTFFVSPQQGQKTGFFLDQRNMRTLVQHFAKGKKVLNCFSYTGAFSAYALSGSAELCDSVDISAHCRDAATRTIAANNLAHTNHRELCCDAFEFLKTAPLPYNFIILDPPAFAKKRSDVPAAIKGYKEINFRAISRMPPNSLLLTCSCSHHIDEAHFRQILFYAAKDSNRNCRILTKHHLAEDHPLNIYHPEGSYLKSFLCYIS